MSRKQNYPECHIINPLLTKFAQSRWLDIGIVLFSAKKKLGQYPAILTSHLVNNPYMQTRKLNFEKGLFSIHNLVPRLQPPLLAEEGLYWGSTKSSLTHETVTRGRVKRNRRGRCKPANTHQSLLSASGGDPCPISYLIFRCCVLVWQLLMCGTGNISVSDFRQHHSIIHSAAPFSKVNVLLFALQPEF